MIESVSPSNLLLTGNGKRPVIDYNIHGLVGIRLLNPSASDAAAVQKQLGPSQGALDREPDISSSLRKIVVYNGHTLRASKRTRCDPGRLFILQSGRSRQGRNRSLLNRSGNGAKSFARAE